MDKITMISIEIKRKTNDYAIQISIFYSNKEEILAGEFNTAKECIDFLDKKRKAIRVSKPEIIVMINVFEVRFINIYDYIGNIERYLANTMGVYL